MTAKNKRPTHDFKIIRTIIIVGVVMLMAVITLIVVNNKSNKLASKDDFKSLQQAVLSIKNGMDGEWQDTSSCTLIEPRLYGDKERYTCNVQYGRDSVVDSQQDIEYMINNQIERIKQSKDISSVQAPDVPTFTIDKDDQFHLNQLGSSKLILHESYGKEQNCGINYELRGIKGSNAVLHQEIGCNIATAGVFLSTYKRV